MSPPLTAPERRTSRGRLLSVLFGVLAMVGAMLLIAVPASGGGGHGGDNGGYSGGQKSSSDCHSSGSYGGYGQGGHKNCGGADHGKPSTSVARTASAPPQHSDRNGHSKPTKTYQASDTRHKASSKSKARSTDKAPTTQSRSTKTKSTTSWSKSTNTKTWTKPTKTWSKSTKTKPTTTKTWPTKTWTKPTATTTKSTKTEPTKTWTKKHPPQKTSTTPTTPTTPPTPPESPRQVVPVSPTVTQAQCVVSGGTVTGDVREPTVTAPNDTDTVSYGTVEGSVSAGGSVTLTAHTKGDAVFESSLPSGWTRLSEQQARWRGTLKPVICVAGTSEVESSSSTPSEETSTSTESATDARTTEIVQVKGSSQEASTGESLSYTGVNVLGFGLFALVLLGAGATMVLIGRRRKETGHH